MTDEAPKESTATEEIPLRDDGTRPDPRPTSPWLEQPSKAPTTEIPATDIFAQPAFGHPSRRWNLDDHQRSIWRAALAWLIAAMVGAMSQARAARQKIGRAHV